MPVRPAVLLLHAFPLDARMWDGIRPALDGTGLETVAPDLPGADLELGFDAWSERVLGLVGGSLRPGRLVHGRLPGLRALAPSP